MGGRAVKASLEPLQIVGGEQDIGKISVPIGSLQFLDDRAIGDDPGDHAFGVSERDQLYLRALLGFSKIGLLDPFQSLRLD